MTDLLTGKELVQKSYEYIDKITKECAKVLLEEYGKNHKKFDSSKLPIELSSDVLRWFEKRDRNVRLVFDSTSVTRTSPTTVRMKFKGNTKDAEFVMESSCGTFIQPGMESNPSAICFIKTLVITPDRNSFSKRKM